MLTTAGTLRSLRRLLRNIRTPGLPTLEELPELAADWIALLPDVDDEELDGCVSALLRSPSPFWPTPGQLLALSPRVKRAEVGEDGAKSAAQRLFHEIIRYRQGYGPGYHGPVVNLLGHEGNTALEAQIQAGLGAIGGWRHLGSVEEDQLSWVAKDFVAAFLADRAIAKADKALTAIPLRAIEGGK